MSNKPLQPISLAQIKAALSNSDGLQFIDKLALKTKRLINKRLMTLDDVIEQGGWVQSQSYKGNIFFIYAGKLEPENKVYYNADTNKLTRSNGKAIR